MQPNRAAVYLTALAGLVGALAPAVANLDTTSTVGVLGGLAVVLGVADRWLKGWQAHEARPKVTPSQPTVYFGTTPTTPATAAAIGNAITSGFQAGKVFHGVAEPDDEPGDPHDGLPHHPVTDPQTIPPDEGDAGEEPTP